MLEYGLIILKGYFILVAVQTVLWLIQKSTKDASSADVGWSLGMAILVGWYAINIDGYPLRKWLMVLPLFIWSSRLSSHLIRRMIHEREEDSRYAQFREGWGKQAERNFFFIFQLQPVFNLVLSVPFFIVFLNTGSTIKMIEVGALFLWMIGFLGEVLADEQLRKFKKDPTNKGKICQEGLWNYSRHPNFFFEWVLWISYFLFALGSPHGVWAIISPLFMLFLLMKVTGIPMMEQRALQNKGEAFKNYRKTTSFFFPMPKKIL